jgi:hypothetical protein
VSKIIPSSVLRETYPEAMAWIVRRDGFFDFATSLSNFMQYKGGLTQGQIDAAQRCVDKGKTRSVEQQANAPTVDTTVLEKVFGNALGRGLKAPRLTIGDLQFSPAKATGANPGAIYVKKLVADAPGEYLGKMMNGKFLARCTQEAMERVLGIAADPLNKAIEHGKLTGRCAVCSRKLTTEESVGRAMGPICYDKFFGGL